jgi:CheY-like chemotaxis protein
MARILIVDDELFVRETIQRILEFQGYGVVLAECGHRGAAAIEAFAFDVALVDIFMPQMDGFETIKIFRRSAPTVPIIAMSGFVHHDGVGPLPELFQKAIDLGAACCLSKPFTVQQLLKAIETSCGHGPSKMKDAGLLATGLIGNRPMPADVLHTG